MSHYLAVAQALAMYSNGHTVQAIAHLQKAGFEFAETLEMLCAFDDAR